jgi:hypothetical protein
MNMAQDFHGVTVTGTGDSHTIVNHSTKPLIGYAIQGHTTTGPKPVFGYVHTPAGLKPIFGRVDFDSVAWGKTLQPGEERHAVMLLSGFSSARPVRVGTAIAWEEETAHKEETLSYELTAVLFADGTFYGPDDILADFNKQIDTARSMARDTQNLEDKYTALKQHEFLKAMRSVNASTDIQALLHRADVAYSILRIRDANGESEAEAALGRLAALPDVQRGEQP